jgi:hypothetical protein
MQQALRSRKVAFVFAAGTTSGAATLESRAREIGLDAEARVLTSDAFLPTAFESVQYASEEQKSSFRTKCEGIGRELLSTSGAEPERVTQRVLGYGNKAYLVVFPYNTPAQTLTCLWSEGMYHGFPWLPLLPRRKKN